MRLHPKLNLYASFIKLGWGESIHRRLGIPPRAGDG